MGHLICTKLAYFGKVPPFLSSARLPEEGRHGRHLLERRNPPQTGEKLNPPGKSIIANNLTAHLSLLVEVREAANLLHFQVWM